MALYITLALVVVIFIVSLFPKFRQVGERHQIPVNFLLTLVATFFGVFLSTQASDRQSREQSQQDAVRLLNSLSQDARNKIAAAQRSPLFTGESKAKPGSSLALFSPSSLKEMVMKDTSLRTFSPEFIVNVNMYASFLESYMEEYKVNEFESTEDFKKVYNNTMNELVVLMALERHLVEGEVAPESHRLMYRCFFNLGSAAVTEDPTCEGEASRVMGGLPQEFLRLKELNELQQSLRQR